MSTFPVKSTILKSNLNTIKNQSVVTNYTDNLDGNIAYIDQSSPYYATPNTYASNSATTNNIRTGPYPISPILGGVSYSGGIAFIIHFDFGSCIICDSVSITLGTSGRIGYYGIYGNNTNIMGSLTNPFNTGTNLYTSPANIVSGSYTNTFIKSRIISILYDILLE
jgi:hypothetical protein